MLETALVRTSGKIAGRAQKSKTIYSLLSGTIRGGPFNLIHTIVGARELARTGKKGG